MRTLSSVRPRPAVTPRRAFHTTENATAAKIRKAKRSTRHTNLRLLEERLVSWWERARQSAAQEAAYVQTGEETTIKVPTTVATSHHRIGVRIEATTKKICTAHAHRMLERRARWGERGGAPAAHRDQMTLPDGDLRAQAIRASRHGCRARHRAQSAAHTFALSRGRLLASAFRYSRPSTVTVTEPSTWYKRPIDF